MRIPVIFEPTAPHNNDSTAPNAVMVKVGAMKSGRLLQGIFARLRRWSRNKVWGIAPIIEVDQFKSQLRSVARMIPRSEAGKRVFHFAGQNNIVAMTIDPRISDWRLGTRPPLKYPMNLPAAVSVAAVWMPRSE